MLDLLERARPHEVEADPRLDAGSLKELRRRGFTEAEIAKALTNLLIPGTNKSERAR